MTWPDTCFGIQWPKEDSRLEGIALRFTSSKKLLVTRGPKTLIAVCAPRRWRQMEDQDSEQRAASEDLDAD